MLHLAKQLKNLKKTSTKAQLELHALSIKSTALTEKEKASLPKMRKQVKKLLNEVCRLERRVAKKRGESEMPELERSGFAMMQKFNKLKKTLGSTEATKLVFGI